MTSRLINGCLTVCANRSGSSLLDHIIRTRLSEIGKDIVWFRELLNPNIGFDNNFDSWYIDSRLSPDQTPNVNQDIWFGILADAIITGQVNKNNKLSVMKIPLHTFDHINTLTQQTVMGLMKDSKLLRLLLLRRSVRDQISSTLLAHMTKTYNISKRDDAAHNNYLDVINELRQNPPPLDGAELDGVIRSVLRSYQFINLRHLLFDQVIWYEDLIAGRLTIPEIDLTDGDTVRILSDDNSPRQLNSNSTEIYLSCLQPSDRDYILSLLDAAEHACDGYLRGYEVT